MGGKDTEFCGRCAMSSVVDVASQDKDEGEQSQRDPFAENRIEIDESELRRVSPGAWMGSVVERLDELATKIAYGR